MKNPIVKEPDGFTYELLSTQRFEYNNDKENSHKFWQVQILQRVDNAPMRVSMKVSWGRIGTVGQFKAYLYGTVASATEAQDRMIHEKERNGYTQVSGAPVADPEPPKKDKKFKLIEVETEWDLT